MKFAFELRTLIGGRGTVVRWRRIGKAWEMGYTMPEFVKEYMFAEPMAGGNQRVMVILDGEKKALNEIREYAKKDKDLRVTNVRESHGIVNMMTLYADIPEPKDVRKKPLSKAAKEALDSLDAYGHLSYTTAFGEEGDEGGDLDFSLDFVVFRDGRRKFVAYHIVANSESGAFIETMETEIVPASKAPYDLPLATMDMGGDMVMTEEQWKDAERVNKMWNKDLKEAIRHV